MKEEKLPELKDLIDKERASFEECDVSKMSKEEREEVSKLVTIKAFKKGDFLVKEGQVQTLCYHVIKGCVRQFQIVNGEEKTTFFYTEGDSIRSISSAVKRTPSKFLVQCLEDCVMSFLSIENEHILYKKYPRISEMSRIDSEEKLEEYREQFSNYITSTPEERYLSLLANRPELLDRVPQYHLASYLGVKPESLSRIRKRISQKQ